MAMTPAGMVAAIKAAQAIPASLGSAADAQAQRDAMLLAICTGIINHIAAAAELVPVTTDQGAAGAGIIIGKVK